MMTLERDGTLLNDRHSRQAGLQTQERIDLPAVLVMNDDTLIDRVFDVIFERLGRYVIELRIHAESIRDRHAA